MRSALVLTLLLAVAAGTVYGTWRSGQPVPLPDGPGERLECASYAPPRFNVKDRPPGRAEIEKQLRIVASRFTCIRTYSTEGIDQVPAAARNVGLRMLLGAWIGSDANSNRREVERLVRIANLNRDVIDALVVGNEVFLRKDLPVDKLRELLVEVRDRTGLPVTTADIWAFWPQDPQLLATVSFVMIHILPYWDDEPSSIEMVMRHVTDVYGDMTRKFPGKPLMIGETGWPTRGRPRGALEPGRVNAARYVREFTTFAAANGIRYNLIEAFDQPWKRPNEGTVGGYWGLFDARGIEQYPLTGPVTENPDWRLSLSLALAMGLLLPLLARLFRHQLSLAGAAAMALGGVAAGGTLLPQWEYLVAGNRDWLDWGATLAFAAAGWIVAGLALVSVTRWLDEGPPVASPAQAGARYVRERSLLMARLGVLLCAAYLCLGLALAGRHRDFSLPLLAVPVLALVVVALTGADRDRPRPGPADTLLATWVGLAAPLIVVIETWRNTSALAFGALCLALAWTVLRPVGSGSAGAREDESAGQDADPGEIEAI